MYPLRSSLICSSILSCQSRGYNVTNLMSYHYPKVSHIKLIKCVSYFSFHYHCCEYHHNSPYPRCHVQRTMCTRQQSSFHLKLGIAALRLRKKNLEQCIR